MNNEAFRALINKQRQSTAAEKSTKEIAREAVENEFEKKRRRGGGGGGGRRGRRGVDDGYGSDSGGSSDEDDARGGRDKDASTKKEDEEDDNVPEWKRRRLKKKLQDGSGDGTLEYRDRAKERREGNNLDYAALQGLAQSGEDDRKRQAELSKYLGGDEEHTHLVKGLDKALAEKVRREEMGEGETGDLDQLLEDAYALKPVQSRPKEAKDWQTAKPKTELGKSVLSYLLQKKKSESTKSSTTSLSATQIATSQVKSNPIIRKSIQRSVLTFSLDSDVRKRKNAWEVPGISVSAFGTQGNSATSRKMTPLNHHMISTITKKLDEGLSRVKERSKYLVHATNGEGKNGTNSDKLTSLGGKDNQQRGSEANSNTDVKADTEGNGKSVDKDDDSDDDIFENAGSYVPQALSPKLSEPATAAAATAKSTDPATDENDKDNESSTKDLHNKQTKQSIFDNLIPETAPTNPTHAPKPQQHDQQHSSPQNRKQRRLQHNQQNPSLQNRNVIDRDVFGGGQNQDSSELYSKRRGPKSAAMEGVSMTSYQGGYGEEMDDDFAGDDDNRREDEDDKEKENSGGEVDGKDDMGDDEED